MKLAIMQPYLFPYIGYFQLLKTVDKFVLYDDVAFINRGWINRNKVLVNGKEQLFTIPLREASQNKKILEIDIDDTQKWRDKLLKTLQQSYKKAPQYAAVYPVIEEILQTPATRITDLIAVSITLLANYLSISTEIVPSSTIYANQHLKGPERILDICLQEGASEYINPIGGMELYDRTAFAEKDIILHFIRSRKEEYPQFGGEFVPWLSIVDVLMFNTPEQVHTLLEAFDLE
jgi:hypothetical protein